MGFGSFGLRVSGSGFRVQDSGFRVYSSGFRVQALEFRVRLHAREHAHHLGPYLRRHPPCVLVCKSIRFIRMRGSVELDGSDIRVKQN